MLARGMKEAKKTLYFISLVARGKDYGGKELWDI